MLLSGIAPENYCDKQSLLFKILFYHFFISLFKKIIFVRQIIRPKSYCDLNFKLHPN